MLTSSALDAAGLLRLEMIHSDSFDIFQVQKHLAGSFLLFWLLFGVSKTLPCWGMVSGGTGKRPSLFIFSQSGGSWLLGTLLVVDILVSLPVGKFKKKP